MEKIILEGQSAVFIIGVAQSGGPVLLHWGATLRDEDIPDGVAEPVPSASDAPTRSCLFPVHGFGFFGEPALLAHRDDGGNDFSFTFESAEKADRSINLIYTDQIGGALLKLSYSFCAVSGVLTASARIENKNDSRLFLQRLNALSLPLPSWATHMDSAYGGWSAEGHSTRSSLIAGKFERSGRSGRPGFDGGPFMLLTEYSTTEESGKCIGVTLAHSGNFQIVAERYGDGDAQLIAAEWLSPGEIILGPGESYETPKVHLAKSQNGLGEISRQFHQYARKSARPTRAHRPVQLNSWEATYFDIDHHKAVALAGEAAALGAERFILDDGWFKNRTGDRSGLGDWTPDPQRFPQGLLPLAEHVTSLGMEFGLWVEPEMVNEDSDLYRAHPDWALAATDRERPTARNQLVLDLTRAEVREYLFHSLDALLTTLPIQYLKWDSNRDLFPALSQGKPAASRQIDGLYSLLSRLSNDHPNLSIEACASGGGRMDYGVLRYADRFWPSDSTDPFERARIQRRASIFFPQELLGAHVGASPNHWTWRQSSMAFRSLVAMFGHFGVELNPAALEPHDKQTLANAIAFYKQNRDLLTNGNLLRLECAREDIDAQLIQSADGAKAIVRVLRLAEPERARQANIFIPNLPKGQIWKFEEFFLESNAVTLAGEFSSEVLAEVGLDAAPRHNGMGRLFCMERIA